MLIVAWEWSFGKACACSRVCDLDRQAIKYIRCSSSIVALSVILFFFFFFLSSKSVKAWMHPISFWDSIPRNRIPPKCCLGNCTPLCMAVDHRSQSISDSLHQTKLFIIIVSSFHPYPTCPTKPLIPFHPASTNALQPKCLASNATVFLCLRVNQPNRFRRWGNEINNIYNLKYSTPLTPALPRTSRICIA